MPLTGKYDFKGIKKWGAKGLFLALSTIPVVGLWLKRIPVLGEILELALEELSNFLANKGLIVINVGAIIVEGKFDQIGFDKAIEDGLNKIRTVGRDKLTPAQGKAIDDAVIAALDKFGAVTRHN